jgi:hypothetical protein
MYTLNKFVLRLVDAYFDGMRDMATEIIINCVHHRNLTDAFWREVAIRKEIAKQNIEAGESVL